MARKMSTAQNEYALTQLGGTTDGAEQGEKKGEDEGPAGFLQFCGEMDELPTPPPEMIRRDSAPPTPPSSSVSSPSKDVKNHRKSIFNFKKDKS